MKFKRIVIISILLLISKAGMCQYTFINGSYTNESNGQRGRLYSVELDREWNKTLVTIEINATQSHRFLEIFTGDHCKISSENFEAPYVGCLVERGTVDNNTLRDIRCGHGYPGYGWKRVKKGDVMRYTLVFHPAIPPGLTTFSLVDDIGSCHGYSFRGYTINNPGIGGTTWTEMKIKDFADKNNDGICGIYETSDETGYRIGCIKSGNEYQLIYLGGRQRMSWWRIGDAKAGLRASATAGVFKADWYMAYKTINSDCYVFFDGVTMTTVIGGEKTVYLKMYPTSSTSGTIGTEVQEWSGTGFALNNGYVVTNYHVVEDAKSIDISGINGDFSVSYKASIVATDKVNDLAIVKISDSRFNGFGTLPYTVETQMAEVGDDVFVLGYPLTQTMGDEIKLTNGIISSRTGFQGDASLYQMSAPIQPGNSGGPMFNSKGNVVGVVCAHHKGTENVGYAIKTSYLKNLAESSSLANIFPTNNTVASLPLSGQVKKLKKYVFLIKCSSRSNGTTSSTTTTSSGGDKTVYYPSVSRTDAKDLTITSITLTDSYTAIQIRSKFTNYAWCSIAADTYITANGNQLNLTRAEGINISPSVTYYNYKDITFTLFFPPIPSAITQIDLIEPGTSDWKLYGIKLQ